MKTIGIIGGLSPESTVSYYCGINAGVQAQLGGHHNARTLINSMNFGQFVTLKEAGDWDTQSDLLCEAALNLERGGANIIILATNTMHKMADAIMDSISIPFLHIGDATASVIVARGLNTIGLLGTKYTMEMDFYKGRLETRGLSVIVPDEEGRSHVNRVIYEELCHGNVRDESRTFYLEEIHKMAARGAQGVILGCTEIGMLIKQTDTDLPVFDTTQIHIDAVVKFALDLA